MNILDAIYPELYNTALQINKETGKQLCIVITPNASSRSIRSITICPKNAYDREKVDKNKNIIHFDHYIYLNSSEICFYSRRNSLKDKFGLLYSEDLEWIDPQLLDKLRGLMAKIAD